MKGGGNQLNDSVLNSTTWVKSHDWNMTHLRPLLPWILLLAFSTLHYSLEFRQQPRGVIRFRVIPQPAQQPKPVARPEAPLI